MTDATQTKRPAALGFIFITVLIDTLGLGVIIPVLPELLETLGHYNVSQATQINGYLTFVYALMQSDKSSHPLAVTNDIPSIFNSAL